MADEQGQQDQQPTGGADLGLRTEMAMGEFMLRHGAKIAGVVVLGIVAIAIYGVWQSSVVEGQREVTASIADVQAELGVDLLELGQGRAAGLDREFDESKARKAADDLAAIAREASGTAAIEAALKAAELYRLVGDAAQRRAVLEAAAASATGVLRYAAVTGLAHLDLEEGRAEEGLARLKGLQQEPAFLARQATLELATALEALGRADEAVKAYDDYLARWPDASDKEEVAERRQKAAEAQG